MEFAELLHYLLVSGSSFLAGEAAEELWFDLAEDALEVVDGLFLLGEETFLGGIEDQLHKQTFGLDPVIS